MFLGLRTVIYPAPDLALDPGGDPATGPVTYWGVPDVDAALAEPDTAGAPRHRPVQEVGNSIRVAATSWTASKDSEAFPLRIVVHDAARTVIGR